MERKRRPKKMHFASSKGGRRSCTRGQQSLMRLQLHKRCAAHYQIPISEVPLWESNLLTRSWIVLHSVCGSGNNTRGK